MGKFVPWSLVLPFLFALLLPLASAADDGGSGRDAPSDRAQAIPMLASSWTGDIGPGDTADWYVLDVPPESIATVTIHATNTSAAVVLVADNGDFDRVYANGSARVMPDARVWVGVVTDGAGIVVTASYVIDIGFTPHADLRVENFSFTPGRDHFGALEVGVQVVHVTVHNVGTAPSTGGRLRVTVQAERSVRVLAAQTVLLAPGESATFDFQWDTTGMIGDLRVVAAAMTPGPHFYWGTYDESFVMVQVGPVAGLPGVDALNTVPFVQYGEPGLTLGGRVYSPLFGNFVESTVLIDREIGAHTRVCTQVLGAGYQCYL